MKTISRVLRMARIFTALIAAFSLLTGFTERTEKKTFIVDNGYQSLENEYVYKGDKILSLKSVRTTDADKFHGEDGNPAEDPEEILKKTEEDYRGIKGIKYSWVVENGKAIETLEVDYEKADFKELKKHNLISSSDADYISMEKTEEEMKKLKAREESQEDEKEESSVTEKKDDKTTSGSEKKKVIKSDSEKSKPDNTKPVISKTDKTKSEEKKTDKSGEEVRIFEGYLDRLHTKVTYTVRNGKIIKSVTENTVDFKKYGIETEEQKAVIEDRMKEFIDSIKDMEGVEDEYQMHEDRVTEIFTVDFEKADLKKLKEMNVLELEGNFENGVGIEETIEKIESQGLKEVK